jgi:uncharacterized protein YbjT (DUF2867 family)
MRILLTGASGYIGKRLLPVLVEAGHEVICCVRDIQRFSPPASLRSKIQVIQVDLLDPGTLKAIPNDIDGAFYLVHSMSASYDYEVLEKESASNFREHLNTTGVKHVVYLSGIVNEEVLSRHLESRKNVEHELGRGKYQLTTLRAGIIIGSGSASFEIMRDLVEKLPVMVAPKWLNTRCQPIAISDVITILSRTILNPATFARSFDIGGPDILSYNEMLLEYGRIRNLRRAIITIPVMTPRLSSYWLYFVTSTSFRLASALAKSMNVEVVCRNDDINTLLGIEPISYRAALKRTLTKIERNEVASSWKDAFSSSNLQMNIADHLEVPTFGCYKDVRSRAITSREACIDRIWSIGGDTGWYYGNWLWRIRGVLDKLAGGVGLRRGRTSVNDLYPGDALDFWRVLYANRQEGRLLLYAEMKLPGNAWLEFKIEGDTLVQTATFRPLGLMGRLYWFCVLPFHAFIFEGMLGKLAQKG